MSRVACMRLLGRDQGRDNAERATLMTRQPRRHPLNPITPARHTQPFSPSAPGPKPFSSHLHFESGLTPRITRPPTTVPKMKLLVSRVACMRLLDGVSFSARPIPHAVLDDPRAPPCLPPLASHEVRPSTTATIASTSRLRHPPRTRIQSVEVSDRPSNLTLRITRPPTSSMWITVFVSRVACMRLLDRLRARA